MDAIIQGWIELESSSLEGLVSTDDPDLLYKDNVAIGHGATSDIFKVCPQGAISHVIRLSPSLRESLWQSSASSSRAVACKKTTGEKWRKRLSL